MKKNGFQIVSPCCTYVSTVMRYVRAQHDPGKKFKLILFFLYSLF